MSKFKNGQPIKINKIPAEVKFKITERINFLRGRTHSESHIQACHDAIEAVYSHSTLSGIMDALDECCNRATKVRSDYSWSIMVNNYLDSMESIKQIVREEIKE